MQVNPYILQASYFAAMAKACEKQAEHFAMLQMMTPPPAPVVIQKRTTMVTSAPPQRRSRSRRSSAPPIGVPPHVDDPNEYVTMMEAALGPVQSPSGERARRKRAQSEFLSKALAAEQAGGKHVTVEDVLRERAASQKVAKVEVEDGGAREVTTAFTKRDAFPGEI